jgi:hypothetical protein
VWEALDRRRDERVAVKVLHSELAGDVTRRERFFRGARLMASLVDEAVVRVVEPAREEEGYCYFVMELLAGVDFQRAVVEEKLPPERALEVVLTIAGALGRAHRQGIVHRDVKPSNILLDAAGSPKLTDFDLALAEDTTGGTRSGAMGTFLYAAPEVLGRPQAAGPAADVYSLGMTAIFGLRGAAVPLAALGDRRGLVAELSCDAAVKDVLTKAVSLLPEERYPDAGMFGAALRQALSGHATPAPVAKESDKAASGRVMGDSSAVEGNKAPVPDAPRPFMRRLVWGTVLLINVIVVSAMVVWGVFSLPPVSPHLPDASSPDGAVDAPGPALTAIAPADGAPSASPDADSPSNLAEDAGAGSGQCPPRSTFLATTGQCIDERTVTVEAYKECVQKGACPRGPLVSRCEVPSAPTAPMVCVDWFEATAYCRTVGGWLPSLEEWREGARSRRFFFYHRYPGESFSEWTGDLDRTPDGPSAVPMALLAARGSDPPVRRRVSWRSMAIGFRCVTPVPPGSLQDWP